MAQDTCQSPVPFTTLAYSILFFLLLTVPLTCYVGSAGYFLYICFYFRNFLTTQIKKKVSHFTPKKARDRGKLGGDRELGPTQFPTVATSIHCQQIISKNPKFPHPEQRAGSTTQPIPGGGWTLLRNTRSRPSHILCQGLQPSALRGTQVTTLSLGTL